ncbi:MAG: TlyA family RNA methyltransferase [Rhodocyclaceae bacterium]|nr:TlyA family RNA methyltransferase [Rhodocyclaceae bacterium]
MRSFHARTPKGERDDEGVAPTPPTPPRDRHGLMRADALLLARGLAPSRTVAQRMIAAGRVSGPDGRIDKPSHELAGDAALQVRDDADDRYVSRGGLKLAGALAHTGMDVRGRSCLDVGQSTGGFTDCLLQAGAARVIGVDVGHAQLRAKLRDDPRVVCIEGINARALARDELGEHSPAAGFDLVVADISFISLTLVLPQLPALLARGGDMLLLVKPQFEMGSPQAVGKGGVVRNPAHYPQVEAKLRAACAAAQLDVRDWFESAIVGGDGNREFFIWAQHGQT